FEPVGDSGGSQQQTASELGIAPRARCLELEDVETLRRRKVWPVLGWYALEASTEQVELAVQQSDLGFEAVVFTSEPEASDANINSPAAGESDRRGSQADDVQDTRADVLGPSARQGYGFRARVS